MDNAPISKSLSTTPTPKWNYSIDMTSSNFDSSTYWKKRLNATTVIKEEEPLSSEHKTISRRVPSIRSSKRILKENPDPDNAPQLERIKEHVKDNFNKRRHDVVQELTKGLSNSDLKSLKDMAIKRALNRTEKKLQSKITIMELFNSKVNERIESSKKIMTKIRIEENPLRISVIHTVLGKCLRVLEAHIDECRNDYQRGLKVNTIDQHGRTALHYAACLGQIGAIEMLIYSGTDPRIQDIYGRTALHYASLQDNKEVVDILINLYPKALRMLDKLSETTNDRTVARLLKYKRLRKMAKAKNTNAISIASMETSSIFVDFDVFDEEIHKIAERMDYSEGTNVMKPRRIATKIPTDFIGTVDHLGRTALHMAALCNTVPIIRALIDSGADLDVKDYNGKKPIDLVVSRVAATIIISKMKMPKAKHKSLKVTTDEQIFEQKNTIDTKDILLMDEESLLNYRNGQLSDNYMILAVKKNSLESVKVLLDRKMSPLTSNKNHWTSVHFAVKLNCMKILNLFIMGHEEIGKGKGFKYARPWVADSWAALDQITSENWTILHIAVSYSDPEILIWLLSIYKQRQEALIHRSTLPQQFQDMKIISLESMLEKDTKSRYTPFLMAVKQERMEMVQILMENNCNIYAHNEKMQNALHIATLNGNKKLIEMIVKADSDRNQLRNERDFKERKPRDLDITGRLTESFYHIWDYAKNGNFNMLREMILTKVFSVNAQTPKRKMTPLHIAVEGKQLHCIHVLIQLGANVKLTNFDGKTALDLALANQEYHFESVVIKMLRGDTMLNTSLSEIKLDQYYKDYMLHKTIVKKKLKFKDVEDYMKIPLFSNPRTRVKIEKATEDYWRIMRNQLNSKNIKLSELFNMIDKDKDGALTFVEFEGMMIWLGMPLNADQIQNLAMVLDRNQNGLVEYEELIRKFNESSVVDKQKRMNSGNFPKIKLAGQKSYEKLSKTFYM
ncbi:unnamed protein product [Blepharisma stoltei]|uniref:EF-hand domain-containing protein n=1 Tax=Blepharisma stoltei TaxID=1481888 RepID=A0AAU9KDR6_9CILI|nr:unnamed protein product [Blepharisma stoltei]